MTTNTNTDYAALTDAGLTRAVAERKRWRGFELKPHWLRRGRDSWLARKTDGPLELVPDYATDTAEALTLLREISDGLLSINWVASCMVGLAPYGDGWEVRSIIYEAWEYTERQWAVDPKPERACCLAWLAWRDEQEAR